MIIRKGATRLLGILLLAGVSCGSTLATADSLSVKLNNELITIEAVNASLIAIGDQVSDLTGVTISYTDGEDSLITTSIIEEPLNKVVAKLSENSIVHTQKINGENVITEVVFLLSDSQGSSTETNLPTGAPADEVYEEPINDDQEQQVEIQEPPVNDVDNLSDISSEQLETVPTQ